MCLAIPMQVITVDGLEARVEAKGIQRTVSLFMLQNEDVVPGDSVLVHVGYAIKKVSPEDASSTWALIDEVFAEGAAAEVEAAGGKA